MIYPAIATVLLSSDLRSSALDYAILCARQWNAHLHVLCLGIDHSEIPSYFAAGEVVALRDNLAVTRKEVEATAFAAKERLGREVIAWDVRATALAEPGLQSSLAEQLRFFDLIVLPRPYGADVPHEATEVFEACLFNARRPVLSVPQDFDALPEFSRVMAAWDDGPEAMGAIRHALPLLSRAEHVDVTMVGPGGQSPDRSDPGGRLAAYLARHGAPVEVNVLNRANEGIARQLVRRATEQEIDLVVMGAYGHSRMREALFGGATRDMLTACDRPILMAHQG
jgi:nucleotide-binding universal stress UspA family protein